MNGRGVFTFSGLTLSKRAPGTRPGGEARTKKHTTPHPGVWGRRGRRAGVVGRHGCALPGQAVKVTGRSCAARAGGRRPQPAESGHWPRRFGPSGGLVSARNSVGAVMPNGRLYPFSAIQLGPGNGTRAQVLVGRRAGASRASRGLVRLTERTKACGPKRWGTRAHERGATRRRRWRAGLNQDLVSGPGGGQRGSARGGDRWAGEVNGARVQRSGWNGFPGASSGPDSHRGARRLVGWVRQPRETSYLFAVPRRVSPLSRRGRRTLTEPFTVRASWWGLLGYKPTLVMNHRRGWPSETGTFRERF
jgi:hypothetical protein